MDPFLEMILAAEKVVDEVVEQVIVEFDAFVRNEWGFPTIVEKDDE